MNTRNVTPWRFEETIYWDLDRLLEPPSNGEMLQELASRESELKAELGNGKLLVINGPASLPIAMFLAHMVGHSFGAVACFDPKLSGYVVAISHDPDYAIGDVIQI